MSAVEKQNMGKCGHFSIRGYVAEIRRQDRKICWPFSTVGDNKDLGEQIDTLPELHVPEFRWWCCRNCLHNSGASDAATEIRLVSDSSEANLSGEERRGNGNTSMDVIGDENCPMICIDIDINEKEMVANVLSNSREDIFTSEHHKKSVERNVNKAVTTLSCNEAKDAQCLNGEKITKDAVSGLGFGIKNLKCAGNISSEICQKGNPVFFLCKSDKMSEQKMELTIPELPEPENVENGVQNSVNVHTIKPYSSEFDDSNEDDIHDQHPASQLGNSSRTLHNRKAQKVRLLADILRREVLGVSSKIPCSNELANSDFINTEVIQTEAIQEYAGLGLYSVPRSQVPIQEDVGKGTMCKKKKRKTPQIEASGSLHMSWPKSAPHCSNRDKTYIDSAVANSESVKDAFAETGLDSCFKNHLIENKIDEKLIQSKKKNKKSQVDDRRSSLKHCQGSLSRELQLLNRDVNIKRPGVEKFCLKPTQDASTGRRIQLFSKTHTAAQKYDRKSVFCMKESKMLPVEDGQACLTPHQEGILSDDQFVDINQFGDVSFPSNSAVGAFSRRGIDLGCITNKSTHRKAIESEKQANMPQVEDEDSSPMYLDANVECTGTEIVPFKAAQDAIMGKGLQSSLICHMAKKRSSKRSILRNSRSSVPKVEGRNASLILWPGAMPEEDRIVSKDIEIKHVETAVIPFKNSPDVCSERGVHFGLQSNKVSRRKASVSKRSHRMLQVEDEVSPIWPKDYSCACNNENTKDARGHLQINKNLSDERVNQAQPESLEDIPMEIVELLAKNRHKRRLLEAEYANCTKFGVPETTKNVKKGGISSTGGNVEPMEEKLSSYLSHLKRTNKSIGSSINHRDDPDDTKGFPAFLESVEKLSSGNQFVDTGSGRNFGIQSCGWNGNLVGYGLSLNCLQPFEAHPTCQIVSRQTSCKEAQHVGSMNMADCPSGIDRFKKFATNNQKNSGKFDFEIFKRINAEQPLVCTQKGNMTGPKMMGSSSLDANEITPAIHLLRLMDAGVSSRASVNVDDYQKFPSQTFPKKISHNEPCLLEDGVFKLSNASKYPVRSASFGKNHSVGKSSEQFPLGPTSNAVASSVQRGDKFRRTTGFTGQVSGKIVSRAIKSKSKEKTKGSHSLMQSTDSRLSGSVSGTGCPGKNSESLPNQCLQKGLFPASNSMALPLQSHLIRDSTAHFEVSKTVGKSWPVKSRCGIEFCSVNRNPADFSIPEAGNEFMIGGGDLKHRKMFVKQNSHRLINTDCHKRQRLKKPLAMGLHIRH